MSFDEYTKLVSSRPYLYEKVYIHIVELKMAMYEKSSKVLDSDKTTSINYLLTESPFISISTVYG